MSNASNITHDIYGGQYTKGPNKDKIIYLRKDQILADIDVSLELVSLSRKSEDTTVQDPFERPLERFRALWDRWINKYVDNCKQRMQAYVMEPYKRGAMNAKFDWEEQRLYLSFPWYWDDTIFDALTGAVHDYIVNSALAEFFTLTFTSKDPLTTDKQAQAQEAYDNIKHYCVTTLPGTMRRKLHPF